jgi:hypothetical protein
MLTEDNTSTQVPEEEDIISASIPNLEVSQIIEEDKVLDQEPQMDEKELFKDLPLVQPPEPLIPAQKPDVDEYMNLAKIQYLE